MRWIFGSDASNRGRIEGMQTPGGTGAVRLAAALAAKAGAKRVHLGLPSWPNHKQILDDLRLEAAGFDHATAEGEADIAAVLAAIRGAGPDDAVLLHGCCHNPTGIEYSPEQWQQIAIALATSPALPIIDLAYHGLGRGMDEDALGLRTVLAAVPEALIAYSCDKNFGLYRDRVGRAVFHGGGARPAGNHRLERQCARARGVVDAARSWRGGGAAGAARQGADRTMAG